MSAILFCLFGSTQTLASQLDRSIPLVSTPSFLRPGSQGSRSQLTDEPHTHSTLRVKPDLAITYHIDCNSKNLGSHLAMCLDDRFLQQGNQILQKICQVRAMPNMIQCNHSFEQYIGETKPQLLSLKGPFRRTPQTC